MGLRYGIILTASYYRIRLREYIMGLYCGIILRNRITESYYGIIYAIQVYYGNIVMKRIAGTLGIHRSPRGPGAPRARPWDPPGTPLAPPGTPLGPPEYAPGTPRAPPG